MNVTVIRSNRKTIAIQVNSDLTVTVRAPMRASQKDIDKLLEEKQGWINKHIEEFRKKKALCADSDEKKMTNEELQELADRALKVIPERAAYYAPIVGVDYGRITIRNQRTRWGSCSSKGNLNFNCLLMLAPAEVLDYVVVHELCHRKEMNHSKAFWNEVERVLPKYKDSVSWLNEHGGSIMSRQNN